MEANPGRIGLIAAMLACQTLTADGESVATYQSRFVATWSAATHPGGYPSNAHFSRLVGATHNDQVTFWEPGALASEGIERMAESGSTSLRSLHVQPAINDGSARSELLGPSMNNPPSSRSFTFDIYESHPLVTLVTMIAPSPDWFVGVHGLALREDGRWRGRVAVDLDPYDAGTDSGVNFTSLNEDTNPQEPISLLSGFPFEGLPPLGQLIFTVQPGDLAADFDLDNDVDGDDFLVWQNGFGRFDDGGAYVVDGDGDGDGDVDGDDFLIWQDGFTGPAAASALGAPSGVPEPTAAAIACLLAAMLAAPTRVEARPLRA